MRSSLEERSALRHLAVDFNQLGPKMLSSARRAFGVAPSSSRFQSTAAAIR